MIIYNYSLTGEYLSTAQADPDPLQPGQHLIPAHATTTAPPEIPDGSIARWTGAAWELVEDHRGEVVYCIDTAQKVTITDLGCRPESMTTLVPPEYPIWDAEAKSWTTDTAARDMDLAISKRSERDQMIDECQWMINRHKDEVELSMSTSLSSGQYGELLSYRQALRDMPGDIVDSSDWIWPVVPGFVVFKPLG